MPDLAHPRPPREGRAPADDASAADPALDESAAPLQDTGGDAPAPIDGSGLREDAPLPAEERHPGGDDPAAFHVEPPATAGASVVPPRAPPEALEAREASAATAGTEAAPLHVKQPGGEDRGREAAESPPAPADAAVHFDRARVLTIANQKGGVGKTTTAVSLSAALAAVGTRVLLVDLDPQGNATSGVGVRVSAGRPTIYEVLVGGVAVEDAVEPTSVRNLFLLPSSLDLAGAEIELVSAFSREQKLRLALDAVRSDYDLILIDCPPSLGLLTVNALAAGDGLLVPIQCEYYALEGLGALRRNIELIRSQLNPDLEVTGFLLTMLDARTRLSQQVVDEVRAHFGKQVFTTRIPRSVRLAEAPGFAQPITVFDPSSRGAKAYHRLAAELLQRLTSNDDGLPPDGRQAEGAAPS